MESSEMIIFCGVLIVICVIWLILLVKTDIMVKMDNMVKRLIYGSPSKITYKGDSIQYTIILWVFLSIASFVLSPVTAYLFCIFVFIINCLGFMVEVADDSINGRMFTNHSPGFYPDLNFLYVGIVTWIFVTIAILIYGINDYEKASKKDKKREEEDKNDKAGADRDKNLTPTPTPLPQPKPALSQVVLPKAPNASVKKYYCLDDGLTTKTWLTMSEAKYYVNTLSLKKLLLLNGKNIVCRVYTKGQWTSHSITRINCDDNGKLSFGRTTKITAS
ncbi:MAG: hypothetical protein MR717_09215 [Prevotella sp.]|nr:hypothetical protein [Prevotella sp.]